MKALGGKESLDYKKIMMSVYALLHNNETELSSVAYENQSHDFMVWSVYSVERSHLILPLFGRQIDVSQVEVEWGRNNNDLNEYMLINILGQPLG